MISISTITITIITATITTTITITITRIANMTKLLAVAIQKYNEHFWSRNGFTDYTFFVYPPHFFNKNKGGKRSQTNYVLSICCDRSDSQNSTPKTLDCCAILLARRLFWLPDTHFEPFLIWNTKKSQEKNCESFPLAGRHNFVGSKMVISKRWLLELNYDGDVEDLLLLLLLSTLE